MLLCQHSKIVQMTVSGNPTRFPDEIGAYITLQRNLQVGSSHYVIYSACNTNTKASSVREMHALLYGCKETRFEGW